MKTWMGPNGSLFSGIHLHGKITSTYVLLASKTYNRLSSTLTRGNTHSSVIFRPSHFTSTTDKHNHTGAAGTSRSQKQISSNCSTATGSIQVTSVFSRHASQKIHLSGLRPCIIQLGQCVALLLLLYLARWLVHPSWLQVDVVSASFMTASLHVFLFLFLHPSWLQGYIFTPYWYDTSLFIK